MRAGSTVPPPPPPEAAIVTLADFEAEPPAPVQVSMKVVFEVSAALVTVPLTGCVPVKPGPEPVQPVAF